MRRKKDRSNGITALYERLSRDDDNAGESNSIVHQFDTLLSSFLYIKVIDPSKHRNVFYALMVALNSITSPKCVKGNQ